MLYNKLACAVALSTSTVFAQQFNARANNGGNSGQGGSTNSAGGTSLLSNVIQKGSEVDGSQQIGSAEAGQALSQTSTNNFINFCSGQTLTNGLQVTTGSCNSIPMGQIPAKTNMVTSIITNPQTGKTINSDTTFNITVQMANIQAGSFTNADATYFSSPQTVASSGSVIGHTHVTVQDLGDSLNPTTALDATQFAFFKGINDAGNGQGLLSAEVTGGLPAGNYRVCTMASASNHQPVIMPVAQRGTADDCTKFVVTGDGKTANVASNDGSTGVAAAAEAASAVAAGAGAVDTASATAAAQATKANSGASATATSSNTGGNNGGNKFGGGAGGAKAAGNGGKFGGKGGKRFTSREFVA